MSLYVLGINHHSSSLEIREKLAFPADRQADALADLVRQPGVAEAVLVSTCNRTEIYFRGPESGPAGDWLEREAAKSGISLREHVYVHAGEAAVRHAFRV